MEKTYQGLKILIWVLAFAVLIAGAYLLYNNLSGQVNLGGLATEETAAEEEERSPAPDVTVYDGEGNAYKLSDFQGKPVILNFWASWCGPCKSEMPEFQKAYETYGQEIHFLLVNLTDGGRETQATAEKYLSGTGYTFPVYFDLDQECAYGYRVTSVPATYFIDAEGKFVAWAQGALSAQMLQQGIDMLIEK